MIRLVVRTNDTEPGDRRYGERPYHSDQEMPERIREWFDAGLEDRDDGPAITWFEARMRPTLENHDHLFALPVQDGDQCDYPGCTLTWAEHRTAGS